MVYYFIDGPYYINMMYIAKKIKLTTKVFFMVNWFDQLEAFEPSRILGCVACKTRWQITLQTATVSGHQMELTGLNRLNLLVQIIMSYKLSYL